jgi:gliding motility-associated-like protein
LKNRGWLKPAQQFGKRIVHFPEIPFSKHLLMARFIFSFLLVLWGAIPIDAQTPLSGVINAYAAVSAISSLGCATELQVSTTNGFLPGDQVLLIQMKGAQIDLTDGPSFGQITELNGAGNWEFATVSFVDGNTIRLDGTLVRDYDPAGRVQLVRVPVVQDALVTSTLTAQPWNGSTGGVLALFVENTLELSADVDVSGLGFRGGSISNNPDGSCGSGSLGYVYPLEQPGAIWQEGGAEKGEGIAEVAMELRGGRGPLANGGGGGNKHNTGGGGGSNYSAGGKGGDALAGCSVSEVGGVGGRSLESAYLDSKVFMGGGGGCGDDNNGVGSAGANGGGLVFLKCSQLIGNDFAIRSNGATQLQPGTGIADGAGGGGAGGAIVMDVQTYSGPLNVEANGGDGGDQQPTFGCVGPGGGGGAGTAFVIGPNVFPPNVSFSFTAGTAGIFENPAFPCDGTTYGAENGAFNSSLYLFNGELFETIPAGAPLFSLGTDAFICPGETLVLDPGIDADEYLWQDGSTDATFLAEDPGVFWVDVTVADCTQRDSIVIAFASSFELNLGPDTTLCPGETQTVGLNLPNNALYGWSDGSADTLRTFSPPLSIIAFVEQNGCLFSDTLTLTEAVPPMVELGPAVFLCEQTDIPFQLEPTVSGNSLEYFWSDGSTASSLTITQSGSYFLEVSDGNCTSSDSLLVQVEPCVECNYYVPNAITPNFDGINDYLEFFSNCNPLTFEVQLFDRWGNQVYRSADPGFRWDGIFRGRPVPTGVYIYLIRFFVRDQGIEREVQLQGEVTVIR